MEHLQWLLLVVFAGTFLNTSHNIRNFNNSLQTVLILKLVSGTSFAYNKKAFDLVDTDLLLTIRW